MSGGPAFLLFHKEAAFKFPLPKDIFGSCQCSENPPQFPFLQSFYQYANLPSTQGFLAGGNVERGFMLLARCAAMVQILAGQDEGRAGILQPCTAGLLGYFVDLIDIFILCRRSRC